MVVRVQVHSLTPILHPAGCEKDEAPVAQLDRVADFESVGRRFESYRAHQFQVQTQNDRIWALSSAGRATDS